jgi:hypothetical protein
MNGKKIMTKERTKKAVLSKKDDEQNNQNEINASYSICSHVMNAAVAEPFNKTLFPDVELSDLAIALHDNIKKVQDGNMASIEAMLIGQAQALQTIFVSLGRKAAHTTQLHQYTAFMGMALKAQSQSRATIQALTELKYPKQVAFVKQANISHGHQQVNNESNPSSTRAPAHAEKTTNQSNELLEVNDGNQTMDIKAAKTAGSKDKAMAAVAK